MGLDVRGRGWWGWLCLANFLCNLVPDTHRNVGRHLVHQPPLQQVPLVPITDEAEEIQVGRREGLFLRWLRRLRLRPWGGGCLRSWLFLLRRGAF